MSRVAGNKGLDTETSVYVQREADPALTSDLMGAAKTISSLIYEKQIQGEEDVSIRTRRFSLSVARNTADKIVEPRRNEGESKVKFPFDWCNIKKERPCASKEPLGYIVS